VTPAAPSQPSDHNHVKITDDASSFDLWRASRTSQVGTVAGQSAKFWLAVLTELRNRGVAENAELRMERDVLIAISDLLGERGQAGPTADRPIPLDPEQ
jgi:hypothetical protein